MPSRHLFLAGLKEALIAHVGYEMAKATLMQAFLGAGLTALEMPVSETTTDYLRDLSSTAAVTLTEQLTDAQLNAIGDTIARAMEAGERPVDAARHLREVTELDRVRAKRYERKADYLRGTGLPPEQVEAILAEEKERLIEERRRTIARTEGRNAGSTARAAEGRQKGYAWKVWGTVQDDRVSDICAANQEAGVIPIDAAFPSGADRTPGHPNCRCSVSYLPDGKPKEIAERRNERVVARTRQAREGEEE